MTEFNPIAYPPRTKGQRERFLALIRNLADELGRKPSDGAVVLSLVKLYLELPDYSKGSWIHKHSHVETPLGPKALTLRTRGKPHQYRGRDWRYRKTNPSSIAWIFERVIVAFALSQPLFADEFGTAMTRLDLVAFRRFLKGYAPELLRAFNIRAACGCPRLPVVSDVQLEISCLGDTLRSQIFGALTPFEPTCMTCVGKPTTLHPFLSAIGLAQLKHASEAFIERTFKLAADVPWDESLTAQSGLPARHRL